LFFQAQSRFFPKKLAAFFSFKRLELYNFDKLLCVSFRSEAYSPAMLGRNLIIKIATAAERRLAMTNNLFEYIKQGEIE